MQNIITLLFLGALGVLCRYGFDSYFVKWNVNFPASTFLVNILGSFLAGSLYAFSIYHKDFSTTLQTGLLVGFCGGFTTFSAYTLQSLQLLERGKLLPALTYLIVSPSLGLLIAFLPVVLMRKLTN